jgi:glucuronate isomerase
MKHNICSENFLLYNKTSQKLFHDIASKLPIIDYHCHLPVKEISENKKFENLTQIWLYGDHYKWRAMRTNGINERYCTGNATDWEKFLAWAETIPFTLRNPLYHWTHLELKNPFGITDRLLNKETAKSIWDECNALLGKDEFSTQGLIKHFNVEIVCTTDDPVDSLEYHKKIKSSGFPIKVFPAFRPDNAMAVENHNEFLTWLNKLRDVTGLSISKYSEYIEAIRKRHDYFHTVGCRISDHGLETAYAEEFSAEEINLIFEKILLNKNISVLEILKFKSAMMYEFGLMNFEKNWVQQLHLGALRNNNTRLLKILGPDTGFDSIGDFKIARPLSRFLNSLDSGNKLAKTIIYNLNPRDNELIATMIGNFQDGTVPGKLQYGSAWWFLDQMDGMKKQIDTLSNLGLLSRFIGMLTDSRSFLSYPRHEYFKRILCSMIGDDVEKGLIPDDDELLGTLVKNVCYYNAKSYFGF